MATAPPQRFRAVSARDRLEISFDDGGMNLLSRDALQELSQIVGSVSSETSVRLITFRSARPGLFAAGADMREMASFSGFDAEDLAWRGQELFAAIEQMPALTVALIDGECFGGALDLAMSFDLRLASPRSRFSHPGARLGIVTGYGGTSRWRKLLDHPNARALLLGSPVLDATAAMEMGLIDRIAEDFELELAALSLIDPGYVRLVKELTSRAGRLSQQETVILAERLGMLYQVK